jgi:hypothetical protein
MRAGVARLGYWVYRYPLSFSRFSLAAAIANEQDPSLTMGTHSARDLLGLFQKLDTQFCCEEPVTWTNR